MILPVDQNISEKILRHLPSAFAGSTHVFRQGLRDASDLSIWLRVRELGATVLTCDGDLNTIGIARGYPPKIIRIRLTHPSTLEISTLITENLLELLHFISETPRCCIELGSRKPLESVPNPGYRAGRRGVLELRPLSTPSCIL